MNEKKIRKLIRLVEESEIESLEVSHWWHKIKITQRRANGNGFSPSPVIMNSSSVPETPPAQTTGQSRMESLPLAAQEESPDTTRLVAIKSPMVGTFYSSPSPDAESYVSLNQMIVEGQVVCIVEAMKLMNEIEAEVSGRITKILAENGKPVEFGQELFLIELA